MSHISAMESCTSRVLSIRTGRIRYRGDWAVKERAIFEAHGYRDGDAIAGDFFPQLWAKC